MAKKKNHITMSARQRREAKRRAYYQANRKTIWTICIAAVAAIIVLALAIDFFYTPAGSMRVFLGNVMGTKDNSIVRQLENGHYYELATMDTPAGYDVDTFDLGTSRESGAQHLAFAAQDAAAPIQSIYVSGIPESTGMDMLNTISSSGVYPVQTEPKQVTLAGHTVSYLYGQSPISSEENAPYYGALVMYVDSLRGSTVLVNCGSAELPQAELPTEEAMLQAAETILAGLTIPQ